MWPKSYLQHLKIRSHWKLELGMSICSTKWLWGSSFRCEQIHKCQRCDFGHTLLCYLSPTWMFNKPMIKHISTVFKIDWSDWGQFVEQKLMLNSNFRCYKIYNCQRYDLGHTLLCYLSLTQMFIKLTYGKVQRIKR